MAWAKRIFLFLAVNLLVTLTISLIASLLGFGHFGGMGGGYGGGGYGYGYGHRYYGSGLNVQSLAYFCFFYGMVGAFVSLALSRVMAKWMMGVQIVDPNTTDPELQRLVQTIHNLARGARLPAMPEVGIYDSPEVNAFATGPTKSRALVAVSSGLLARMDQGEIEGVLGHEITHVSNGDMVTMTLIQGIVNAFVMFLSRIVAFAIMQAMRGDRDEREGGGFSGGMYFIVQFVLEIVFMILGSIVIATFSRWREYRADAGGARLAGRGNMIAALEKLRRTYELVDTSSQPAVQTLKINGRPQGMMRFFASHPPLEDRIARLQQGA